MTYSQAITGQGSVECRISWVINNPSECPQNLTFLKLHVSLINNSIFDYLSHSSCRNCSYFQFSKLKTYKYNRGGSF